MKSIIKELCECGKEISGFSEQHLIKNLEIHRLFSKEHKERIELKNSSDDDIIITLNMSNSEIIEMLSNHPIMIEDIREIGRSMKNNSERMEERNEKKIMVS